METEYLYIIAILTILLLLLSMFYYYYWAPSKTNVNKYKITFIKFIISIIIINFCKK